MGRKLRPPPRARRGGGRDWAFGLPRREVERAEVELAAESFSPVWPTPLDSDPASLRCEFDRRDAAVE